MVSRPLQMHEHKDESVQHCLHCAVTGQSATSCMLHMSHGLCRQKEAMVQRGRKTDP